MTTRYIHFPTFNGTYVLCMNRTAIIKVKFQKKLCPILEFPNYRYYADRITHIKYSSALSNI